MELHFKDLNESNSFLNVVLNNMNSALFISDKMFRIVNFNNTFSEIFEKDEKDIVNKYCGNVIGCMYAVLEGVSCGDSSACKCCPLRNTVEKSFEDKDHINKVEMKRYFFIDGKKIEKYFSLSTKYISHNHNENVLVILDDITDHTLARKRLEELNDTKTKYMSILAHDLRTPLTSIIGFSDLIFYEKYSKNLENIKKLFFQINKSGNYMLDLVNDLLDITTIENGKLDLKISEVEYIEFSSEVVKMMENLSKRRDIKIKFNTEIESFKINMDENRIRRVLENLLSNAIKYSHDGDFIEVGIRLENNYLITEIIDRGPGVDEKHINNIFQPYIKTGVTPKTGEKGTGLGLSISRSIIEKHSGVIGIDKEWKNGAKFYFKLPFEKK